MPIRYPPPPSWRISGRVQVLEPVRLVDPGVEDGEVDRFPALGLDPVDRLPNRVRRPSRPQGATTPRPGSPSISRARSASFSSLRRADGRRSNPSRARGQRGFSRPMPGTGAGDPGTALGGWGNRTGPRASYWDRAAARFGRSPVDRPSGTARLFFGAGSPASGSSVIRSSVPRIGAVPPVLLQGHPRFLDHGEDSQGRGSFEKGQAKPSPALLLRRIGGRWRSWSLPSGRYRRRRGRRRASTPAGRRSAYITMPWDVSVAASNPLVRASAKTARFYLTR